MFNILTGCPREYMVNNTNCTNVCYAYCLSARRYAETILIVQMFIMLTGCLREYTRKQYQLCNCLLYLLGVHEKIRGNNTICANVYYTYWMSARIYAETIPIVQMFIILTGCLRKDTLKQYQLCKYLLYLLGVPEKICVNNNYCPNVYYT